MGPFIFTILLVLEPKLDFTHIEPIFNFQIWSKFTYRGDPHELRVTKSTSNWRVMHRVPRGGPFNFFVIFGEFWSLFTFWASYFHRVQQFQFSEFQSQETCLKLFEFLSFSGLGSLSLSLSHCLSFALVFSLSLFPFMNEHFSLFHFDFLNLMLWKKKIQWHWYKSIIF